MRPCGDGLGGAHIPAMMQRSEDGADRSDAGYVDPHRRIDGRFFRGRMGERSPATSREQFRVSATTLSFHMIFCDRWKNPAAPCRAPAGGQPSAAGGRRRAALLGAVPCYLKSHSQGEYVFDHGWADAFERAGGRYYPKLQVSVPFTPATGPRLLDPPRRSDAAATRERLRPG